MTEKDWFSVNFSQSFEVPRPVRGLQGQNNPASSLEGRDALGLPLARSVLLYEQLGARKGEEALKEPS